jgi:hypothetical protein
VNPSTARRLWKLLEPYHAVVYFAPEVNDLYAAAGTKGYWMGYFASRSAAMGPVGPGVVTATFFNFAPGMVRRAIPDAWAFSSPDAMLAARLEVADRALRRLLGDMVDDDAVGEAADLALTAAEAGDPAGRPLYAAHVAQTAPREPHLRLWHAATCLREHRGDGHVAMLLTSALDGCEANVIAAAAGVVPADVQASRRGWGPEEWDAARQRLIDRGLLDGNGEPTPGGAAARDAVEAQTDALALPPYEVLDTDGAQRLEALLEPIARRLLDGDSMPYPNPVGVPRPF